VVEIAERLRHLYGPSYDPVRHPVEMHPEAMAAVLDRLEVHYGSAVEYLLRAGVTEAQIEAFRRHFVT